MLTNLKKMVSFRPVLMQLMYLVNLFLLKRCNLNIMKQLNIEIGIYIISACGFDSIPAELGFNFIQEIFALSILKLNVM